jgi:transcriptional regulator with XRE-family HTH domain
MTKKHGQYIIELRKKKGISQRMLANLAGLQNSTISRIEDGSSAKPDPVTLNKIADALDIERTLLLSEFGYTNIEEDFVAIARKTGELTKEQRNKLYDVFNKTIDDFLEKWED